MFLVVESIHRKFFKREINSKCATYSFLLYECQECPERISKLQLEYLKIAVKDFFQRAYILKTEKLYTVSKNKTRSRLRSGSDHELLIAKFRLKLKKVGKTTRPFRYNLNQIPYN